MSNAEHLANVMVQAFIDAVENGVDLVPVVADSTSTAKIAPFIKHFPDRLVNVVLPSKAWSVWRPVWRWGGKWR